MKRLSFEQLMGVWDGHERRLCAAFSHYLDFSESSVQTLSSQVTETLTITLKRRSIRSRSTLLAVIGALLTLIALYVPASVVFSGTHAGPVETLKRFVYTLPLPQLSIHDTGYVHGSGMCLEE
jgi:hypothetical protein